MIDNGKIVDSRTLEDIIAKYDNKEFMIEDVDIYKNLSNLKKQYMNRKIN